MDHTGLTLFEDYERDAALRAFAGHAVIHEDDRFVTCGKALVCFLDLGKRAQLADKHTLNIIVEFPSGSDPRKADSRDPIIPLWMSEGLRDALVENRRRFHVFARRDGDPSFSYLGEASVGGWGRSGLTWLGCGFAEPLPREVCRRFGEFPDFRVTINGKARNVADAADLERELRALEHDDYGEVWINRYEGDALSMLFRPTGAALMYMGVQEGDSRVAINPEQSDSEETADFYLSNGQRDEYPLEWVVPRSLAERALMHFMRDGVAAPFVAWKAS